MCQENNSDQHDGGGGSISVTSKRKHKRVPQQHQVQVQEVTKIRNNLYDQIAQESFSGDHNQHDGGYYKNNNNNDHDNYVAATPYGMKLSPSSSSSNKARNPRAEPNYLRNYHYSSRGMIMD
jgi:hypothetical protein